MSITLTTPFTLSIGGVQLENDLIGACTSMSIDFVNRLLVYTFSVGSLAGNPPDILIGPYAQTNGQQVSVMVYVGPTTNTQTFGQWWLNGVRQASIIPSATLAPTITQLLANRNTAESFVAVSGGLMPGTQVPWTQL